MSGEGLSKSRREGSVSLGGEVSKSRGKGQ